jgi:septal ring factor EnvC (AmiA/AmiB activator)
MQFAGQFRLYHYRTPPPARATMNRCLPLLCALMLALPAGTGLAAGEDAALKKSTQELSQLRSRIQALDQQLARDRGQRDQLLQKIEASEEQLETLGSRLQAQRSATEKQAGQLRKTQAERARAEQQLGAERKQLARQIRAAYVGGLGSDLGGGARLMLQQSEPARLTRLLTYFDYLNRARADVIAGARKKSEALLEVETRQQQEMAQLAAAHARQELTASQLGTARAERLAALARLREKISGGEGRLQELRSGEREIETLITRLRALLADLSSDFRSDQPLARQKGRLPWPLRGKLLARFGTPKADGKLKWSGLWIAAKEGVPVRVVANGRVAYVGRMQRYGLLAVVEHGDGFYSLYGHNGSVERSTGDTVKAGEVLARAGASGGHEDTGLYFELRKGSQPVNPMDWLAR